MSTDVYRRGTHMPMISPVYNAPTSTFRGLREVSEPGPGRHVLGVVNFTASSAEPRTDQGYPTASVHLADSVDEGVAEVWTTSRPVETSEFDGISYAQDGAFLFCTFRVAETDRYAQGTEAAYTSMLDLVDKLGYRVFRIWHYISQINDISPNGLEYYREFCVGRAQVLERRGITHDMPAATVIGAHSGGIVCYLLAYRDATQVNIENPRQVPAYHYPSQYGPKAPNFARATYLAPGSDGDFADDFLYVSGTASILGHRTVHAEDVESQCRLALDNVAHVIGAGNMSVHGISRGHELSDLRTVKVYVRHRSDMERVRRICQDALPRSADVVFLHADICRSDLLVELEGVVQRADAPVD